MSRDLFPFEFSWLRGAALQIGVRLFNKIQKKFSNFVFFCLGRVYLTKKASTV